LNLLRSISYGWLDRIVIGHGCLFNNLAKARSNVSETARSGNRLIHWPVDQQVSAEDRLTTRWAVPYHPQMHALYKTPAAPPDPHSAYVSIFIWGAVLIGLMLLFYFGYSAFKRWMNDTGIEENQGFTLSDLRKLRDQGKISPEEFEQTRNNMLVAAKKMTQQMPDVLQKRNGDGSGSPPPTV